jgi:hypothetical protein
VTCEEKRLPTQDVAKGKTRAVEAVFPEPDSNKNAGTSDAGIFIGRKSSGKI